MQSPFYALSDTLDVGYSYPWVNAPREVYNDFVFTKFQGIDLRYSWVTNDYSTHIETYYGTFDDTITVNNVTLDTKVNDLAGLIGEFRVDNFHLRSSYHTGNVTPELPQLQSFLQLLETSGFANSAAKLDTENERATFLQISLNYESLDYLVKAEWIKIETDPALFSDISGYYLTYGHYLDKFTFLLTYGKRSDKLPALINDIPIGLSPQLDQLAFGYQAVIDARAVDDTDSWTLGFRWDFAENTALKAEYKMIESHTDTSETFEISDRLRFDNQASLLLVALEWVF